MITPNQDKQMIKAILDTDAYIQRAGFTPENIRTTRHNQDIVNSVSPELQIFIYQGNPETGSTYLVKNMVYVISIAGKRNVSGRIDSVSEQVIALLHEKEIGKGHILYLLDAPIEMASDNAIYILEMSFLCQATVYNTVKK